MPAMNVCVCVPWCRCGWCWTRPTIADAGWPISMLLLPVVRLLPAPVAQRDVVAAGGVAGERSLPVGGVEPPLVLL